MRGNQQQRGQEVSVKPNQSAGRGFSIEGQITREQTNEQPGALPLSVYAFDRAGALLSPHGFLA